VHINVPRAVGFAEDMRTVFERRSAVLLERAPGDGFDRVWTRLAAESAPVARGIARHDLAVRMARFVAAFHETGFCHRDLYLCHIFVDLDAAAKRPPVFTLIDLARTHRPRSRRMRWIIKDLSQLDVSARQVGASRSDRWRFLLAYLNLPRGAPRARWYARRIVRKSDWILRRIARKS
jgi:heptose I phosphotransferase